MGRTLRLFFVRKYSLGNLFQILNKFGEFRVLISQDFKSFGQKSFTWNFPCQNFQAWIGPNAETFQNTTSVGSLVSIIGKNAQP